VLLLAGCFDDSGSNPELSDDPFFVDQTGRTIVFQSPTHDVTVTLVIPANALDRGTTITIEHAASFPDAQGLVANAVFNIGPANLNFNIPAELSISYGVAVIGNLSEDDLRIATASQLSATCPKTIFVFTKPAAPPGRHYWAVPTALVTWLARALTV